MRNHENRERFNAKAQRREERKSVSGCMRLRRIHPLTQVFAFFVLFVVKTAVLCVLRGENLFCTSVSKMRLRGVQNGGPANAGVESGKREKREKWKTGCIVLNDSLTTLSCLKNI